ncbi:MAG: hypothetical protein RLZZ549_1261 [Pseudomonadota bacterium]
MNKPILKSARPLLDCLQEEQGLQKLMEQAKRHENRTSQVQNALKKLGFRQLAPLVSSPAISARLQQIMPSLIKELSQDRWVLRSIKVKVRPRQSLPQTEEGIDPPPFSGAATLAWQSLYDRLSPNSSIREAVAQLLNGRKTRR